MHIGHQVRSLVVFIVTLHEQLSSLIIQATLRKWVDQEASNDTQDMRKARLWRPILFQSVDANGAGRHVDIWVVNFGQKESPRRRGRELGTQDQFESKAFPFVWSALWSFDFGL